MADWPESSGTTPAARNLVDRGIMFTRRITLFKLLGFEVRVDASWLIIAALVTWTLAAGVFPSYYPGLGGPTYFWMGVAGAVLFFGSIVVHELCHSLVARRYGIPMKGITLFVFGGIAELGQEPPSAISEFMMAIAGPAASVLIGIFFYAIERAVRGAAPIQLTGVLAYLARINWILAAFNMIPAFPLDGGRVLRALLWHHNHDLRRATRTASRIGSAFGVGLIVLAVLNLFFGSVVTAIWYFMIGMFLRAVAQNSYQQVVVSSALQGEPVRKFMHTDLDTVTPDTSIADLVNEHMYRNHHHMLPVLSDSNRLEGCVTPEQVKSVPREEWQAHTVQEIAKPCSPEDTITPDTESTEALRLLQRSPNAKLMVVEDGRLVAIVSMRDLTDFLATKLELEGGTDKLRAA
jgi:Zn-dependent protease/predicted transcriptional regulator